MEQERTMILRLLAGRKISPAEAEALLGALRPAPTEKALVARVWEDGAAEPVVHLKVPLSWARFLAPVFENKLGPALSHLPGFSMVALQAAVEAGEPAILAQAHDGRKQIEIRII